jgi:hypothetical protein
MRLSQTLSYGVETHRVRRGLRELRALLETGGLQLGVNALGFLAGFAALWLLPVSQFAFYTVANSMLGTLTVLTDCGVVQGVLAHGGRSWQDRAALGRTLASGGALRRRLAVVSTLAAVPILYLLLRQQGATLPIALVTSLSIMPMFLATLSGQLLEVVLKLHQEIRPLQRIQLRGAALRLLLTAGAVAAFPYAWIASAASGLAQVWATLSTRRLTAGLVDLDAEPESEATSAIVSQIKRMAPGAVYYALAGQINVWLISILGTARSVAEVGALGRLTMAFGILTGIMSLLYVPRFARLPHGGARARRLFLAMQAALGLGLGAVVVLTWLFPGAVLALLGPKYASLRDQVTLAVAGGAAGLLASATYSLSAARGVVLSPIVVLPTAIAIQILLAVTLPVWTVAGVLWLALLSNLAFWLLHGANFIYVSGKAR